MELSPGTRLKEQQRNVMTLKNEATTKPRSERRFFGGARLDLMLRWLTAIAVVPLLASTQTQRSDTGTRVILRNGDYLCLPLNESSAESRDKEVLQYPPHCQTKRAVNDRLPQPSGSTRLAANLLLG